MEEKDIHDTNKDENERLQNKNTEQENPIKTNVKINHDKNEKGPKDNVNMLLLVCIIGITLGIALEVINMQTRNKNDGKKRYIVWSKDKNVEDKNGLLKHLHLVLERLGYEKASNGTPWDLLWAYDFPFVALYPSLNRLKAQQRLNHVPGIGYIANKVHFATTNSKYIPKAFELPKNKDGFLKYASENRNAMFLEKHNGHRGVYVKNVSEIDYGGQKFVQEFIQKPFLVDGYKFDIGVYVVVTSVRPLRLYWYKGDVLFRYCLEKYYPLNATNLGQYVIGDNYRPTWKVPALAAYSELGLSMRDAFDTYATSKGANVTKMWDEVQKAIVEIFLLKSHHLRDSLKDYASQDNFFEMVRVDLIVDEELNVHLLEANMSPNLSAPQLLLNQLLYEQVLYNLFSITGVANDLIESGSTTKDMVSSQKNIAVFGKSCSFCKNSCEMDICRLCKQCIDRPLRDSLLRAYREFLHRGDFRRLFPPPMKQGTPPDEENLKNLTNYDKLQYIWYQAKCDIDITWCT